MAFQQRKTLFHRYTELSNFASFFQAVRVKQEIEQPHGQDAVVIHVGPHHAIYPTTIFLKLSSMSVSERFSCARFSSVSKLKAD